MSGLRSANRKEATLQHRTGFSRTFQRKVASGLLGKFCHAKNYRGDQVGVGRNDECPCGSGVKFKKCCGGG